jgi:hypothetical protein
LKHWKGKRQPAKESTTVVKKEKTFTLGSKLGVVEGVVSMVRRLQMNENQVCQSQVHVTA